MLASSGSESNVVLGGDPVSMRLTIERTRDCVLMSASLPFPVLLIACSSCGSSFANVVDLLPIGDGGLKIFVMPGKLKASAGPIAVSTMRAAFFITQVGVFLEVEVGRSIGILPL